MEGELRFFQKFFRCQKVPSHIQKNGKQMLMQLMTSYTPKTPFLLTSVRPLLCLCLLGHGGVEFFFSIICRVAGFLYPESQHSLRIKKKLNAFSLNMTEDTNSTVSQLDFHF